MAAYIALIHKDAGSDFGVSFPDLPGCYSAGSTLEEAARMAAEALAVHLDGLLADGDVIPEPSSLDDIMADPAQQDGGVAVLVPAPPRTVPSVRVNITLPADVLAAIDGHAAAHGYTRSGFLAAAARQVIAGQR